MITVQWCRDGELAFCGQEFLDHQYQDALIKYEQMQTIFDLVRIIMSNEEKPEDWIVVDANNDDEEFL